MALPILSSGWGPAFTLWLGPGNLQWCCAAMQRSRMHSLHADAFSCRGAMGVFERFTHGNGEAQGG